MNVPLTLIESTLVPHTAFQKATARLEQCYRYSEVAIEPISMALIGESRTGKSRCIKSLMLKFPSYRSPEGMTIPILYVSTPAAPTKNLLVEEMLLEMGDERFDKGKETVKTGRLRKLLKECGTRMIIIDEFQHFVDKASDRVAYQVADWLKLLVDKTNVTLVVAGLSSCTKVLDYNEQLDGRVFAPITLPRFDWMNDDLRGEFVSILGSFEESMRDYFDIPSFMSDEMAFRFFCASGGLIGYVAKILRVAVWNASDAGQGTIGLSELRVAYETAVRKEDPDAIHLDPFTSEFSAIPGDDILALVGKLGTRVDPPPRIRGARNRKATSEKPEE
jgi:hypothetical protein